MDADVPVEWHPCSECETGIVLYDPLDQIGAGECQACSMFF
jgi:hypothetical protein